MAPNLKLNLLALNDSDLIDASHIDTNALKTTPTQPQTEQLHAATGDSASYWDWPSDAPAAAEVADSVSASPPNEVGEVIASARQAARSDADTVDDTLASTTESQSQSYWDEQTYEKDIDSKFFIDYTREMGRGDQQGTVVRKAIERKTGQRFAVKTCSKRKSRESQIKQEAALLMACCDHPNILDCHGIYEDSKFIHIVTEYAKGGELYQRVIERAKKNPQPFSEPEAAHILQQILAAVAHCHSRGIAHRDVKLENILMAANKKKASADPLEIKLIDFGLAARLPQNGHKLTERVGTNYYVAPEVLNENDCAGYDQGCDVWAVGVVAFALFSAKPPFRGVTDQETFDAIQSQELAFNDEAWQPVSESAKEFIRACLQKDPKLRPSAQDLLQQEWIIRQSAQLEATPRKSKKKKHLLQRFKKALHLS